MLSRYKNSYLSYVIFYVGYYAVFSVFGSVLAVYLAGLGLGDREVSLVLSAGGIFSLAITPISGWLHDRSKSQKQVLTVTLCLIALLAMAFSACRSVGLLFLLGGMVNALVNSVTPVCERVAGSSRYRYGLLRVWGTIGYAMGAQAAGLAIERLPSWAPFALTAGSCGLCLLGLWGAQVSPPPQKTSATAGKKPRLRELGKSPQFFLFLGAGFLFAGCSGVNINFSPLLLSRLGVPAGAVGTVLFFSTLTEIPMILFSHKFMDRLSGKTLTGACFVLAVGQYLVYGLAESAGVVVTVMVLMKAVTSTLYMMLSLKMVRGIVPVELTTTGLSVVAAVNNLAGILLQNAGGYVSEQWGVGTLYLGMAALCAGGLVLTAFLRVRNDEKVFG